GCCSAVLGEGLRIGLKQCRDRDLGRMTGAILSFLNREQTVGRERLDVLAYLLSLGTDDRHQLTRLDVGNRREHVS
ncbi:hypothetical protein, partial [Salmonella enterica]|uniref:hypothetical protein n=1 Tax=Salmonella enterica TaxID=28901 RepID=UPI0015CE542F